MTDRGSRLWPLAIVAVLGLTVGANGYLLIRANDDPMPLERDYYRKAVAWDSTMAQARRNLSLGWRLSAALSAEGNLEAILADGQGNPITDAIVTVDAFPIAFEDGEASGVLATRSPGYATSLTLRRPGLHEFRFAVTRGEERFTATLRGAAGSPLVPAQ
ncbi:MAG: hypothetical protein FJ206_10680 [Gemmatimonadetes bacterium]|nr:hypothetical protein [Gemmatimonadota bacterium]